MEAQRGDAERVRDPFVRWCWVVGALLVLLVVLLASPLDESARRGISQVSIVVAGATAAASCGWRAARSTGRRRRAWSLLSIGGAIGLVGNLYAGLVADPTTGDVAYITALLLGVVGLAFFPTVRPRGKEIGRMLLDSVVVGGSVLYIALYAVTIGPDAGSGSGSAAVTAYLLPVVDALLATFAVLVMTRSSASERVPLVLVGSGFVLYAVADVAFALLSADGTFTFGSPIDVGWVGGYLMIALAARHRTASGSPVADEPAEGSAVLGTTVTFCLFLAAALVRVAQSSTGVSWAPNALWVVVLVAVVARQVLVVADNESLLHGLERRVEERTSQLRALASERARTLESVADGIYGVDPDGLVTFVNPAACRTLGASQEALIGQAAHALFHAPDADGNAYPAESCYVTEAVRDGVTTVAEQDVYLRGDGSEVPVEVTASPLKDDGRTLGAVVVFRDITDRREVERLKDEFVSVVSHELRTPLTSIRGALGLLDSGTLGPLPERSARMVHVARLSSERLNRLVDDILDIERMDSGTTPLERADHRVGDLVTTATEQVGLLAREAGVEIVQERTDEVVSVDGDRIVQMLTNLLSNAVKFSPRGTTVRVSTRGAGDLVELQVEDEGRGIPPDKLEAVFGRFEQVDASDSRERGGSGLGLAISRSIVERHGGRLWAESSGEGTGSTFRATLPPAVPQTDHPPRVVVVDDDLYVVDVLRSVLESRGYDVVGVTDGAQAFAAIEAARPAAVVLDLAMPGRDGHSVLDRVRRTAATANVPVVIVSGSQPSKAVTTASLADRWLVKPVAPAELERTVREVIALRPHHEHVLVVEDDPELGEVLRALLQGAGLVVTLARSVREAHDVLATPEEPALVVLDLALPDGAGREVVAALRRDGRLSRVPLVVYSGARLDARQRAGLRLGDTVFLRKGSTSPEKLLEPVLELLDTAAGRTSTEPGRPGESLRTEDEWRPGAPPST
ncbi:hypothetical protein M768_09530 [Cellulosimicrobium cellulans F16]|uniref:histidine kinase n=1 Tax=Cellulosimicrobium cellulans F16 TaxID=1350482 RepID=A0A0M0F6G5_CELCE|nr:response regulator [Cellulosimicrobium cellulans]KON73175.1 hypothetical protein M768_09530 [Cellulosimicrobium cellulans F16]